MEAQSALDLRSGFSLSTYALKVHCHIIASPQYIQPIAELLDQHSTTISAWASMPTKQNVHNFALFPLHVHYLRLGIFYTLNNHSYRRNIGRATAKHAMWHYQPFKTLISLCIRTAWLDSLRLLCLSLVACRSKCEQQRHSSACAEAHAELCLRCSHYYSVMFCCSPARIMCDQSKQLVLRFFLVNKSCFLSIITDFALHMPAHKLG